MSEYVLYWSEESFFSMLKVPTYLHVLFQIRPNESIILLFKTFITDSVTAAELHNNPSRDQGTYFIQLIQKVADDEIFTRIPVWHTTGQQH